MKTNNKRTKYWDTMVDILDRQFPKKECKERGRAIVLLSHIEMMLQGWKFSDEGKPISPPEKEKTEKIFIGMHRPTWEQISSGGGYIQCSCGVVLQTVGATREHWQLGHFDTPVYKNEKIH